MKIILRHRATGSVARQTEKKKTDLCGCGEKSTRRPDNKNRAIVTISRELRRGRILLLLYRNRFSLARRRTCGFILFLSMDCLQRGSGGKII